MLYILNNLEFIYADINNNLALYKWWKGKYQKIVSCFKLVVSVTFQIH